MAAPMPPSSIYPPHPDPPYRRPVGPPQGPPSMGLGQLLQPGSVPPLPPGGLAYYPWNVPPGTFKGRPNMGPDGQWPGPGPGGVGYRAPGVNNPLPNLFRGYMGNLPPHYLALLNYLAGL